jgi:hypothetical protein
MRYLYSNARQNYFYLSLLNGLKTAKNKMQWYTNISFRLVKLHFQQSYPQLTSATVQIENRYFLNVLLNCTNENFIFY